MTLDRAPASTDPKLSAGVVLADKYRLERELGRGAMGTVWRATHVTLEQVVAIKIISREHSASAELRQRVSTEARAAAKLRSRHVVGVYDHGETEDGLPFIVLEYLEGETLEDRLTREGPVPLRDAVRIVRHVGRALSRAHAHAIVHRDLKPANIFITRTEDDERDGWLAKVLDFGVAKMNYSGKTATKTGALIGTPLFMSPEQVRGASDIDHRADLYSLGMVFYTMITRKYAFDGATFGDLLISICTDPLPSLREEAPWASDELEAWFQRACARAPEDRFVDADEMVEALEAAAELTDLRPSLAEGTGGRPLGADAPTTTAKGHPAPDAPGRPRPSGSTAPPDSTVSAGSTRPSESPVSAGGAVPPGRAVSPDNTTPPASTTPPAELTNSSISSPGAAITVHLPPPHRSRTPWVIGTGVIGAGVVAAGLGVALSSTPSRTSGGALGGTTEDTELTTSAQGAVSAPSLLDEDDPAKSASPPTSPPDPIPAAPPPAEAAPAEAGSDPAVEAHATTNAALADLTAVDNSPRRATRVPPAPGAPQTSTTRTVSAVEARPARRASTADLPATQSPAPAEPPLKATATGAAQKAKTEAPPSPAPTAPPQASPAKAPPGQAPPPKAPSPAPSAPRLPDLGF